METIKSVINIIFSEYNNFFDAEKKIADYILANKTKVIEMTISELAEKAGTSEATITRFCKKCNMKGFHHLKITLAQEIVDSEKDEFTISGSVTKLQNNKRYYARVRAYKVINGEVYYGKWSNRKVKLKK